MSELRLGHIPSSAFLHEFNPEKIKIQAGDAFTEIAVGNHQFEVAFPTDGLNVEPKYINVAREILTQIAELDAVAMREVDGTKDDGELFVLDIISEAEVGLRYSAAFCNSDWCEMFNRGADGIWVHQGVRTYP